MLFTSSSVIVSEITKFSISTKYNWNVTKQRENAKNFSQRDQKLFVKKINIKLELSFITQLTSILNFIFTRIYDAFHFE